jgi:hypothetical protein
MPKEFVVFVRFMHLCVCLRKHLALLGFSCPSDIRGLVYILRLVHILKLVCMLTLVYI